MTLLTSFWQREHSQENNTSPSLEQLSQFIEECLKANEFSTVGYTLWCHAKEGATDSRDIDNIRENIRAMLGFDNDDNNKADDDPNKKLLESCENVSNTEWSKQHNNHAQVHTHDMTEADADKNADAHTNNLSNLQNAVIALSSTSTTIDTELSRNHNNNSNSNNIDESDTNLSTLPLPEPSPEPRSALAKLIAKAKKETSHTNKNVNITYHSEIQKYNNNKKSEMEYEQSNKRPKLELVAQNDVMSNQNKNKDVEIHITQAENNKFDNDEEDAEEFTVDLEQGHAQHDNLQDTVIDSSNNKNTTDITNDSVHTTEDEHSANFKHPSQMTREEFLRQYKRAPRRGEIGQSAEMVAEAQKLGYVMSGSRNKGADRYVDRVQRQLHEREAAKLQQQFRRIEDARMDESMINSLVHIIEKTRQDVVK